MAAEPRLIFAGTPEFAARHLKVLIDAGMTPCAVYTQPDRPAGRGRQLQASEVKQVAEAAGIPIYQPESLKQAETQQALRDLQADLMIVVAYGLILPGAILAIPRLGCINVHASLLPRWRGAAPIQRAIEAGDHETGITIMQMDEGLDTGDMLLKASCPISEHDTAATLHEKLAEIGSELLPNAITELLNGRLSPERQQHDQATYAHKLAKSEGQIDWMDPATVIARKVRAFYPWPGSQCNLGQSTVKCRAEYYSQAADSSGAPGTIVSHDREGLVVEAADGHILITHLQFPGKRMLAIPDILNANPDVIAIGQQFQ